MRARGLGAAIVGDPVYGDARAGRCCCTLRGWSSPREPQAADRRHRAAARPLRPWLDFHAKPEDVDIPEDALSESFLAATGPGGQNVNKVATACQLRVDVFKLGLQPRRL